MVDPKSKPVPPAAAEDARLREKVRLRFRKEGDLRFVSHHDLLRCFERALRRAEIPFARTQGFNPHPRIVFALSLPLGVVGCEEIADVELKPGTLEEMPPEAMLACLNRESPPGLSVLALWPVERKASLKIRSFCYRIAIPEQRLPAVRARLQELTSAEQWPVDRVKPKKNPPPNASAEESVIRTRIDVRPFVKDIRIVQDVVEMDLWLTPQGTARPGELLQLLNVHDLHEKGAMLERSRLVLEETSREPDNIE